MMRYNKLNKYSGTDSTVDSPFRSWLNVLIVTTCVLGCLLPGSAARAQEHDNETSPKKLNPSQPVSIDFNNVDINVLIKFISEMTGKNFVVDQRVKGKVTIISPSKISVDEAYRFLNRFSKCTATPR
jgi:type II secretory pathway component GspD/PulD (secretin)